MEELRDLLVQINKIVSEMTEVFLPRIDAGEWDPDTIENESYPPGYIYEDILEFFIELLNIAFYKKKGDE